MARRVLNRHAKRVENDQAEQITNASDGDSVATAETPKKKRAPRVRKPLGPEELAAKAAKAAAKAAAKPRVRKKTIKEPPRRCVRWAVCDNGMKRIAVFDYRDRADADAKLAELREKKTGTFFLQMVKDPYTPADEPLEAE